jgi:hypothetical protein
LLRLLDLSFWWRTCTTHIICGWRTCTTHIICGVDLLCIRPAIGSRLSFACSNSAVACDSRGSSPNMRVLGVELLKGFHKSLFLKPMLPAAAAKHGSEQIKVCRSNLFYRNL